MPILGSGDVGQLAGQSVVETTYTWTTADGTVYHLSDHSSGRYCLAGRGGFELPPMAVDYDDAPDIDGGLFRNVRVLPRELFLPLLIIGPDVPTAKARRREIARAMFSQRGQRGTLRSRQPDGSARSIPCYYSSGMTGSSGDTRGPAWARYGLTFLALQPYWVGEVPITAVWRTSAAVSFFPVLPMRLSGSNVIGPSVGVTNPGEVETYPTWTVHGPAGPATFTHNDTGAEWSWEGGLIAGEWVKVDTTRGAYPQVVDQAGADAFSDLAANPEFWALQPGLNSVSMVLTGATADSSVELTAPLLYVTE